MSMGTKKKSVKGLAAHENRVAQSHRDAAAKRKSEKPVEKKIEKKEAKKSSHEEPMNWEAHRVPEHLQRAGNLFTQKEAKAERMAQKKIMTPEQKAEIKAEKQKEKDRDKRHAEQVKKSQAAMKRRK